VDDVKSSSNTALADSIVNLGDRKCFKTIRAVLEGEIRDFSLATRPSNVAFAGRIKDRRLMVRIDSGADISVISFDMVQGTDIPIHPSNLTLRAANSHSLDVLGYVDTEIVINWIPLAICAVVVLLGLNFLRRHHGILNFHDETLHVYKNGHLVSLTGSLTVHPTRHSVTRASCPLSNVRAPNRIQNLLNGPHPTAAGMGTADATSRRSEDSILHIRTLTSECRDPSSGKVFFGLHPSLDFVELHGLPHLATTRATGTLSSTSVAVVVPLSYVGEVLKAFHEDPWTAGHYGVSKIHPIPKSRFWWPTLLADLTAYVAGCIPHQRHRLGKFRNVPIQPFVAASRPCQVVSVDVIKLQYFDAGSQASVRVELDLPTQSKHPSPYADNPDYTNPFDAPADALHAPTAAYDPVNPATPTSPHTIPPPFPDLEHAVAALGSNPHVTWRIRELLINFTPPPTRISDIIPGPNAIADPKWYTSRTRAGACLTWHVTQINKAIIHCCLMTKAAIFAKERFKLLENFPTEVVSSQLTSRFPFVYHTMSNEHLEWPSSLNPEAPVVDVCFVFCKETARWHIFSLISSDVSFSEVLPNQRAITNFPARGVQPVHWRFPFLQAVAPPCNHSYVPASAAVRRSTTDPIFNQVKRYSHDTLFPSSEADTRQVANVLNFLENEPLFNVVMSSFPSFVPRNDDIASWNRPARISRPIP
jgi:hypothetical protein